MTSNRPYLLRALYEWIVDNGLTPHVLVDARDPDTVVPEEHVRDGRMVLNVSAVAVPDLVMGNDALTFRARFSGRPFAVRVPVRALLAIYAKENGKGMAFPPESPGTDTPAPSGGDSRPSLRVIK